MSPELMAGGPRYAPGAAIGDYVVPQGDRRVVFGETGFVAQVIGFNLSHPEYTVGVGAGDDRGQLVDDHGRQAPEDMDFFKTAGGVSKKIGPYSAGLVAKTGHYRIVDGKPGNKVVPTITAYCWSTATASYAMYGTAFAAGRDLAARIERLRVRWRSRQDRGAARLHSRQGPLHLSFREEGLHLPCSGGRDCRPSGRGRRPDTGGMADDPAVAPSPQGGRRLDAD